jgi:TP901 family phage tail tape measure protein
MSGSQPDLFHGDTSIDPRYDNPIFENSPIARPTDVYPIMRGGKSMLAISRASTQTGAVNQGVGPKVQVNTYDANVKEAARRVAAERVAQERYEEGLREYQRQQAEYEVAKKEWSGNLWGDTEEPRPPTPPTFQEVSPSEVNNSEVSKVYSELRGEVAPPSELNKSITAAHASRAARVRSGELDKWSVSLVKEDAREAMQGYTGASHVKFHPDVDDGRNVPNSETAERFMAHLNQLPGSKTAQYNDVFQATLAEEDVAGVLLDTVLRKEMGSKTHQIFDQPNVPMYGKGRSTQGTADWLIRNFMGNKSFFLEDAGPAHQPAGIMGLAPDKTAKEGPGQYPGIVTPTDATVWQMLQTVMGDITQMSGVMDHELALSQMFPEQGFGRPVSAISGRLGLEGFTEAISSTEMLTPENFEQVKRNMLLNHITATMTGGTRPEYGLGLSPGVAHRARNVTELEGRGWTEPIGGNKRQRTRPMYIGNVAETIENLMRRGAPYSVEHHAGNLLNFLQEMDATRIPGTGMRETVGIENVPVSKELFTNLARMQANQVMGSGSQPFSFDYLISEAARRQGNPKLAEDYYHPDIHGMPEKDWMRSGRMVVPAGRGMQSTSAISRGIKDLSGSDAFHLGSGVMGKIPFGMRGDQGLINELGVGVGDITMGTTLYSGTGGIGSVGAYAMDPDTAAQAQAAMQEILGPAAQMSRVLPEGMMELNIPGEYGEDSTRINAATRMEAVRQALPLFQGQPFINQGIGTWYEGEELPWTEPVTTMRGMPRGHEGVQGGIGFIQALQERFAQQATLIGLGGKRQPQAWTTTGEFKDVMGSDAQSAYQRYMRTLPDATAQQLLPPTYRSDEFGRGMEGSSAAMQAFMKNMGVNYNPDIYSELMPDAGRQEKKSLEPWMQSGVPGEYPRMDWLHNAARTIPQEWWPHLGSLHVMGAKDAGHANRLNIAETISTGQGVLSTGPVSRHVFMGPKSANSPSDTLSTLWHEMGHVMDFEAQAGNVPFDPEQQAMWDRYREVFQKAKSSRAGFGAYARDYAWDFKHEDVSTIMEGLVTSPNVRAERGFISRPALLAKAQENPLLRQRIGLLSGAFNLPRGVAAFEDEARRGMGSSPRQSPFNIGQEHIQNLLQFPYVGGLHGEKSMSQSDLKHLREAQEVGRERLRLRQESGRHVRFGEFPYVGTSQAVIPFRPGASGYESTLNLAREQLQRIQQESGVNLDLPEDAGAQQVARAFEQLTPGQDVGTGTFKQAMTQAYGMPEEVFGKIFDPEWRHSRRRIGELGVKDISHWHPQATTASGRPAAAHSISDLELALDEFAQTGSFYGAESFEAGGIEGMYRLTPPKPESDRDSELYRRKARDIHKRIQAVRQAAQDPETDFTMADVERSGMVYRLMQNAGWGVEPMKMAPQMMGPMAAVKTAGTSPGPTETTGRAPTSYAYINEMKLGQSTKQLADADEQLVPVMQRVSNAMARQTTAVLEKYEAMQKLLTSVRELSQHEGTLAKSLTGAATVTEGTHAIPLKESLTGDLGRLFRPQQLDRLKQEFGKSMGLEGTALDKEWSSLESSFKQRFGRRWRGPLMEQGAEAVTPQALREGMMGVFTEAMGSRGGMGRAQAEQLIANVLAGRGAGGGGGGTASRGSGGGGRASVPQGQQEYVVRTGQEYRAALQDISQNMGAASDRMRRWIQETGLPESAVRGRIGTEYGITMLGPNDEVMAQQRVPTQWQGRRSGFQVNAGDMAEQATGMQRLGLTVEKVGMWGVATGAVYGFLRAIREAMSTMTQFEDKMAGAKVLMPLTTNWKKLAEFAGGTAREYGTSIMTVMDATRQWMRQYKDLNQVLDMTREAIKLSRVDNIDLAKANKYLESTINEFNLSATSAQRIVDSWTNVTNNAQVAMTDLAGGISRAGAAAKIAGVDFDELNGMIAAGVRATGETGQQIGQMLKTVFGKMYTDKAVKTLQDLGIAVGEMREGVTQLRPAGDILEELANKWNSLSRAQQQQAAMSMAGGVRQWSRLAAMLAEYQTAVDATAASQNAFGTAAREVSIRMDTVTGALSKLKGAWSRLIGDLGFRQNVLKPIREAIDLTTELVDAFSALPDSIKAATVIVGALAAKIATLNLMFRAFGMGNIVDVGGLWYGGISAAGMGPEPVATPGSGSAVPLLGGGGAAAAGGRGMAATSATGQALAVAGGEVGGSMIARRMGSTGSRVAGEVTEEAVEGGLWSRMGRSFRYGYSPKTGTTLFGSLRSKGVAGVMDDVATSGRQFAAGMSSIVGKLARFAKILGVLIIAGLAVSKGYEAISDRIKRMGMSESELKRADIQEGLEEGAVYLEAMGQLNELRSVENPSLQQLAQIERLEEQAQEAQKPNLPGGINTVAGANSRMSQLLIDQYLEQLPDMNLQDIIEFNPEVINAPRGVGQIGGTEWAQLVERGIIGTQERLSGEDQRAQREYMIREYLAQYASGDAELDAPWRRPGISLDEVIKQATGRDLLRDRQEIQGALAQGVPEGGEVPVVLGQYQGEATAAFLRPTDEGFETQVPGMEEPIQAQTLQGLAAKMEELDVSIEALIHPSREVEQAFLNTSSNLDVLNKELQNISKSLSLIRNAVDLTARISGPTGVSGALNRAQMGAMGRMIEPTERMRGQAWNRERYVIEEVFPNVREEIQTAINNVMKEGQFESEEAVVQYARKQRVSGGEVGEDLGEIEDVVKALEKQEKAVQSLQKAQMDRLKAEQQLLEIEEQLRKTQDQSLEYFNVWDRLTGSVDSAREAAWGYFNVIKSIREQQAQLSTQASLGAGHSAYIKSIEERMSTRNQYAASVGAAQINAEAAQGLALGGVPWVEAARPGFSPAPAIRELNAQMQQGMDVGGATTSDVGQALIITTRIFDNAVARFEQAVGSFSGGSGGWDYTGGLGAPGRLSSVPARATGGMISQSSGEDITAQSPRDSVLIRAQPGEAILNKKAVQAIGHRGVDELNKLPGYQGGGIIGDPVTQRLWSQVQEPSIVERISAWMSGGKSIGSIDPRVTRELEAAGIEPRTFLERLRNPSPQSDEIIEFLHRGSLGRPEHLNFPEATSEQLAQLRRTIYKDELSRVGGNTSFRQASRASDAVVESIHPRTGGSNRLRTAIERGQEALEQEWARVRASEAEVGTKIEVGRARAARVEAGRSALRQPLSEIGEDLSRGRVSDPLGGMAPRQRALPFNRVSAEEGQRIYEIARRQAAEDGATEGQRAIADAVEEWRNAHPEGATGTPADDVAESAARTASREAAGEASSSGGRLASAWQGTKRRTGATMRWLAEPMTQGMGRLAATEGSSWGSSALRGIGRSASRAEIFSILAGGYFGYTGARDKGIGAEMREGAIEAGTLGLSNVADWFGGGALGWGLAGAGALGALLLAPEFAIPLLLGAGLYGVGRMAGAGVYSWQQHLGAWRQGETSLFSSEGWFSEGELGSIIEREQLERRAGVSLEGLQKFAQGGEVKPSSGVYDATQTQDKVLTALSPGEYVVNREASEKIGRAGLDAINRGDMETAFNVALKRQGGGPIDERYRDRMHEGGFYFRHPWEEGGESGEYVRMKPNDPRMMLHDPRQMGRYTERTDSGDYRFSVEQLNRQHHNVGIGGLSWWNRLIRTKDQERALLRNRWVEATRDLGQTPIHPSNIPGSGWESTENDPFVEEHSGFDAGRQAPPRRRNMLAQIQAQELERAMVAALTEWDRARPQARLDQFKDTLNLTVERMNQTFSGLQLPGINVSQNLGTGEHAFTGLGSAQRTATINRMLVRSGAEGLAKGPAEVRAEQAQQLRSNYLQGLEKAAQQANEWATSTDERTSRYGRAWSNAIANLDKFGTGRWKEVVEQMPQEIRGAVNNFAQTMRRNQEIANQVQARAEVAETYEKAGAQARELVGGVSSTGQRQVGRFQAEHVANRLMGQLAPTTVESPFEMMSKQSEQAAGALREIIQNIAMEAQQEGRAGQQARMGLRAFGAAGRGDTEAFQQTMAALDPEKQRSVQQALQLRRLAQRKPPREGEIEESIISGAYGGPGQQWQSYMEGAFMTMMMSGASTIISPLTSMIDQPSMSRAHRATDPRLIQQHATPAGRNVYGYPQGVTYREGGQLGGAPEVGYGPTRRGDRGEQEPISQSPISPETEVPDFVSAPEKVPTEEWMRAVDSINARPGSDQYMLLLDELRESKEIQYEMMQETRMHREAYEKGVGGSSRIQIDTKVSVDKDAHAETQIEGADNPQAAQRNSDRENTPTSEE